MKTKEQIEKAVEHHCKMIIDAVKNNDAIQHRYNTAKLEVLKWVLDDDKS